MTNSKGPPSVATTPSKAESRVTSEGKSRISTTETGFKDRFRQNNTLDCYQSQVHPYSNKSQITQDFFQSRDSASPPPSMHLDIGQMLSEASNEREIDAIVSNYILKPATTELGLFGIRYKAKFDKQWTAFPNNVGFNNGLSAPKPDLTEGYMRKTFPPIINGLGGCATLVKDDPNYVALPHFVAEFKDVGKDMNQAEIQAGYDGAAMVYARNQALAYLGQPDPPRHAAVASVISDGHNWKVFVHYSHENQKTKEIEWYQVSSDLTFSPHLSSDCSSHFRVGRNKDLDRTGYGDQLLFCPCSERLTRECCRFELLEETCTITRILRPVARY